MRGEGWRRAGRSLNHRDRIGSVSSRALRLALPLLASLALLLGWGLAATTRVARASGNVPVNIVTPTPDSSGNAQGPVGAYVTISAQNLNTQDTYVIGVGVAPGGCSAQYIPATTEPRAPDSSGNLVTTIIWPSAANAVGSSYYICVQDHILQGSAAFQSAGVYTVRSASPPAITLTPAPQTSASGTPVPIPPQGGNTYYAGSQITITGANFVPGGQPLVPYLIDHQVTSPSDFQAATPLSTVDNSSITADSNGNFTATVQLPQSTTFQSGKFYLYVISQDAQSGFYPSLIAAKSFRIVPQPTPTPTVTVAPTAVPATPTPSGQGTGTGGGINNPGAVIGLGVTSVLLFVIGVILLASAAGMQRPQR